MALSDVAARVRPAHVPDHLVTDFDLYDVPIIDADLGKSWAALKKRVPGSTFWSDRHEGYWTVLAGRDVEQVYTRAETFSSADIFIPPNGSREHALIPLELDPPESLKYRRVIQTQLMPAALDDLAETARGEMIDLIDGLAARQGCDFIRDFAGILPIIVFLTLMGLPRDDRDHLVPLAEMSTRPAYPEQRLEGHLALRAYLRDNIAKRLANPGADLLSRMALAEVDGERMTEDELLRFTSTVMIGGLDTVTNLMGFTALHLARNPDKRRELIANPELVNAAVDEYVRRFGVVGVARRVIRDVTLGDADMKAGDMVLAPTFLHSIDDTIFDRPLEVDFHRKQARNMTFGGGAHLCLGMHLAKRELRMFLTEWLARIPDFAVTSEDDLHVATGIVSGLTTLPLRWSSAC
ncbi:cytochrome P450 [Sphingomonadaceae bacterium jetA1]|uniref:cytochrome P450 n=1 Tax=Facivitalis istanbulensis TaxID=3075838 RepID=UPI00348C4781